MGKKVYTHENRFLVWNARNILDAAGIENQIRNEYASSGAGELSPIDSWPELWVNDEEEYERAVALIEKAFSEGEGVSWRCEYCGESNGPSFEICWNCQQANE
jgi:hypothetical protein